MMYWNFAPAENPEQRLVVEDKASAIDISGLGRREIELAVRHAVLGSKSGHAS